MAGNAKTTAIPCEIKFGVKNEWGHIPGCEVMGCKRPAVAMWTPMMAGKPPRKVCKLHDEPNRKLWLYKGAIYDHTEEEV
jgi:hypothetical protein